MIGRQFAAVHAAAGEGGKVGKKQQAEDRREAIPDREERVSPERCDGKKIVNKLRKKS